MTPEEINKIITEHCGHTYHKPTQEEFESGSYYHFAPNCYRDLGSMHWAETYLTPEELNRYADILCDAVDDGSSDPSIVGLITLTASQKAEAYVRAIGKWK